MKCPEGDAGVANDATEDTPTDVNTGVAKVETGWPRSLAAPIGVTDAATSGNRSPEDATGVTDVALAVVIPPDVATGVVTGVDSAFTTSEDSICMSGVDFVVTASSGNATRVSVVEVEAEVVRPCKDVVGVRDVDVTIARSAEEFTDVNKEVTLVDSVGVGEVDCKATSVGVGVTGVLGNCPLSRPGNTLLPPGLRPLILYL